MNRRNFLDKSAMSFAGMIIVPDLLRSKRKMQTVLKIEKSVPYVISTWNFSKANEIAGKALYNNVNALDAAVEGVAYEEANIQNTTVGNGGAPDRDGNVTLDASVMDHMGNCGSVMAVENITHVAALAKEVMKKTPHVILAGKVQESSQLSKGIVLKTFFRRKVKRHGKNG